MKVTFNFVLCMCINVVYSYLFYCAGTYLRKNSVLKELWLAHNDLTSDDAYTLGIVLKANLYLQFLDISNNNIEVMNIIPSPTN